MSDAQIDHVSMTVADEREARAFYGPFLAELGLTESVDSRGRVQYGRNGRSDFGCYSEPREFFQSPHVAFAAPSRQHVDGFHATALKHGGRSLSAPVERPEFGFYSAYLTDPEGNVSIQAVGISRLTINAA
jgi:catechol 2,3-dioxygenase-like lactoylglutathione lyase family enzyme